MREVFDQVAADYRRFESSPLHRRLRGAVVDLIRGHLPAPASILDVGCGPGTYAIPLAAEGYRVTAVDIAPRMLEELDKNAARARVEIETVCLDAASELSALGTYDAAISIQGPLSYTADPLPLARNIAARVRSGGLVIFALARAAHLEQLLAHPQRALAPFFSNRPLRITGTLAGQTIEEYLHDPDRLEAAFADFLELRPSFAVGLSRRLPAAIDRRAGTWPLLRRLGATTVYVGYAR